MSHDAPQQSAFRSEGNYRTNITAFGVEPGVLCAQDGRLSFVGRDGRVYFDAPFAQFHSVGLAEMNETLEIWHGPTRHRISLVSGGPMIGHMVGEFESDTVARRWRDYLAPLVGEVPQDVHVKKPVSKGLQLTITLVLCLVLVIAVILGVFLLA